MARHHSTTSSSSKILLLLFITLLSLASAVSLSLFSSSSSQQHQSPLLRGSGGDDDDLAVPGDNPLEFCAKTDAYTLDIQRVDLDPNPPLPGKNLTIAASGSFTTPVAKGAYINISVKYGLIKILTQTFDLCDQMANVDEECPLEGDKVISKVVELPKEIPPGKYTVLADVYTKDDEQITCLTARVSFYQ